MVPGEIVTVKPSKQWRFAGHSYISGEIESTRLDVAALGLLKSPDGYIRRKDARRIEGLTFHDMNGTLKRQVLDVEEADNLVVLKTTRGSAKQVGFVIDNNLCDQVVGTVAGLDTVLLATRSPADASSLRNALEILIS